MKKDAKETVPSPVPDLRGLKAVVLDLDGVVTDTASVHARAWKHLFDAALAEHARRTGGPFVPFDIATDYPAHVDGLPRLDGVRTFLASRHIALPEGSPDDAPDALTIHALGQRKNAEFQAVLEAEGVEPFPGAVRILRAWKAQGLRLALCSSSRNAARVLDYAGLSDLFDAVMDGRLAAELGLPGKPAPDTFVKAAAMVGVSPAEAAVVEDATVGTAAGRDGGFALVIGISRGDADAARALREAGADIVLNDLGDLPVSEHPTRRPVAEVPSATDHPDALRAALGGRKPAVFLDYDGTLTPIVERPDLAVLSERGRAVVTTLAARLPTAVVSGRDRLDVERLVGVDGLIYAGSHGFDVTVPGQGALDHGAGDFGALLDDVEARLHGGLDAIPGALIERKKFSIAAHYRQVADADYAAFRAVLDGILAAVDGIKEKPGKKVFELQPAIDWDKGKCVLHLMDALKLDGHLPMFFGDDVTDEDAFAALQGIGLGVVVADPAEDPARTTAAAFRVDDTDQLLDLLEGLE